MQNDIKNFQICGGDFAEECRDKLRSHAVIVTRDGKMPSGIVESRTSNSSRLNIDNKSPTSIYSSSKIQNGYYKLLPKSVRKRFKELHQVENNAHK